MKSFALIACLLSVCLASGCVPNPFEDLASVPAADRVALKECLDAPDLPDNQWPENAAKARCWLSLPQDPSLKEIAALLQQTGGASQLDRRYADILAAHYADRSHRGRLFRAYQDFGTPEGQRLAADWLAKSPGSPFARLARGEAALGAAWKERGNAYMADTTQAQLAGMTEQLKIAVPMLQMALRTESRLSPACVDLMNIGDMIGDPDLHEAAAQHCIKVDPLSWNVNAMYLQGFDPRWGGSFDAMDHVIEQMRVREENDPILASLLAIGIGRRAYLPIDDETKLAPIATELERAARTAPDAFYIDKAGKAAAQSVKLQKALTYYSEALRFAPDEPDFLIDRAELLARMGNGRLALADAHRAMARPDACNCRDDHDRLAMIFERFGQIDDERSELQRVVQDKDKDQRRWALLTLCQTYFARGFDSVHGLACTKQLVEAFPDDSEANYMRALSLYIVHDPGAAEFDARFRKLADPNADGYTSETAQLDQFTKQ
jgi:tetratricopeptide (TPR) repeat protein